ncbi:hypothetical protein AQUCO_11300002v1 [Aquilegia coerulea]|uniref:Uncharacterized protein n=1 Tax=Aquilegia coerulea TaxID=218851 RepID=A0A2G5C2H4_AQUCA|nr:hypothetical protein AQUCO_11300002v1 [Aquilegia coerulea]
MTPYLVDFAVRSSRRILQLCGDRNLAPMVVLDSLVDVTGWSCEAVILSLLSRQRLCFEPLAIRSRSLGGARLYIADYMILFPFQ